MSLTKLSVAGIIKLFPARESLVSDIPAGDGKNDNLFLPVLCQTPFKIGSAMTAVPYPPLNFVPELVHMFDCDMCSVTGNFIYFTER
jgi:hypothetical protein